MFTNRSVLAAFPRTARDVRGWSIARLLFDEAARQLDTDGNQADEPVYRSLARSIVQFGSDGRTIVASSPYGLDGFFSYLFHAVEDGGLPEAYCAHATLEMRPGFATAALELERQRDPNGYRSEYGADFVQAVARSWMPHS